MTNLFNVYLCVIFITYQFQNTHGDETTTQPVPTLVFNETEYIENYPPYLENGTVLKVTSSNNETVPIYQRFKPALNIIKDLAAIEVPSKEISLSVATLAPILMLSNRTTPELIHPDLDDYPVKEVARQSCWNTRANKQNYKNCRNACVDSYLDVCRQGGCIDGFFREARQYCTVICKENYL